MNDVAIVQEMAPAELGWTPEMIRIIRNTVAPGLTDEEFAIFGHNCARTQLDPVLKQIYAIKRGGRLCIQVSIDGFRLIADRTHCYAPGRTTEYLYDANGKLLGATVYVKKRTPDGVWHEFSSTAFCAEYDPGQGLWRKMPHVMIAKCAEASALRRAFPADLGGLYVAEEMDQAAADPVATVPSNPPKEAISEDNWAALDSYLLGHDDLRAELMQLCSVSDLRDINDNQLELCRKYVQIKRRKNKPTADKNESPTN